MTIEFGPTAILSVNVRDVKKAVEWYSQKLGFGVNVLFEELPWADMATSVPGLSIGLSQAPKLAGQGGATITFEVADAAATRAQLEARGVEFRGENRVLPGMVILADFVDLDGNPMTLAQSLM